MQAADRALQICKRILGEKHNNYAISLMNVARLHESQGNYAKSEPLYRKALDIKREVLGEKHPDYATCLHDLAFLYKSQAKYAEAEPLYRKAIDIKREVLGEEHPAYATSLNNLADLYLSQGDYAGAERLYRKALDIKREVLGEKHPARVVVGEPGWRAPSHHIVGEYRDHRPHPPGAAREHLCEDDQRVFVLSSTRLPAGCSECFV